MAFRDARFPVAISRGVTFGPRFSTSVVDSAGGAEERNINWSYPRCGGNAASGLKRSADYAELIAFARAVAWGKGYSFPFKDWSDYTATDSNIGTGDGSTVAFQLRKVYTFGGFTAYRKITKPVTGISTFKVDGSPVVPSSVARLTGIVTFSSPPANGKAITWSGQFDVPCRFDTDELPLTLQSLEIGEWTDLPLLEVDE